MQVSIIIVNYKVEKEILSCVSSIFKSRPEVKFETIVVDNENRNKLKLKLNKEFPQVKYIKAPGNFGFGAGNNLGAKAASGEYLFFLNPDTLIKNNAVDELYSYVKNNSRAGMVAPLLFDPYGKAYLSQGSDKYDFGSAIIVNSFLNKLFPNNPISKRFFHKNWDKKKIEEFDVVPGTAFMISKRLFEKAGMFDEKYFLYFEEYDLAKRVKKLGYNNYIVPDAKVLHVWEASAKKSKNIGKIFSKSRYYFFEKNYGRLLALIVHAVANFGKYEFLLGIILCASLFLGMYRINELMIFIGDQGWFYLSARDMLINGQIPLVGIASSHPWLHQGAYWTYLLSIFLWVFNFNPVSGAYLTIFLGLLSVLGMHILGSMLFSKRAGLIAALLYATSPLMVYYMRLPYHTSTIPLLVIALIPVLYKIVKGNYGYLPFVAFLLVVLYNFEIATVTLWVAFFTLLAYRFLIKKDNVSQIFNRKIILSSSLSLIIPLLPMILYDIRNGFPQTIKFTAWIFYRIISLFGYNPEQAFSIDKITEMFNFLSVNLTRIIFASNSLISQTIFFILICWIAYLFLKKKTNDSHNLIIILLFVPLILVLLNQIPSDAYLPIFFPTILLLISSFFDFLMSVRKLLISAVVIIAIIVIGNMQFMFKNNFSFDRNTLMLENRILASRIILNVVGNKDYNLIGKGRGSEFKSFTMNYEYLTWWLGRVPSRDNEDLKIFISESEKGIKIQKEVTK